MGDDGARGGEQGLYAAVTAARRRLARIAGREHLRRKAFWGLGAGAVAAVCRPIAWRLATEAPPWLGLGRALGLFAAGSAVATVALIAAGRRRGPSEVAAARAIDGAIGSAEVIASGFAFARDGREEPVVLLARKRAATLAEQVRPAEMFPLPSLRPRKRASVLFALGAIVAIGIGGYEPALATALLTPPTASENADAAELEDAAADVAEEAQKDVKAPSPEKPAQKRDKGDEKLAGVGPALADKAKEAARAARRGDRRGALEKLEELRSAGQQKSARAGDLGATLRKVAEALSPPSGEKQGGAGSAKDAASAGKEASEEMRLLANKMKSPEGSGSSGEKGAEQSQRVLERLERAAEEARRSASEGKSQEAADAARALSKAAASLKRGDREAAAQALEQAAERAAAMEQARAAAAAEAMAIAEMLEKSGALERAIQAAMIGKDGEGSESGEQMAQAGSEGGGKEGGKEGSGNGKEGGGKEGSGSGKEGNGKSGSGGKQGGASMLRSAIMARLAAMGMASPPEDDGSNGTGPHIPDRQRQKRAALAAQGSIRAPSQVGEGPRAIQAISGLGKGTEPPKEYREVFPSYDAAAEEGLADERIPAQRRAAVRRYFQAIRPDQHE